MPDPTSKTTDDAVARADTTGTPAAADTTAEGSAPADAPASVEGGEAAATPETSVATSDSVGSEGSNSQIDFGALSQAIADLTTAVTALRDDGKTLRTDMEAVKQSVEELGSSTVARSDGDDPIPQKRSDNEGTGSVFKGAIFRN